MKSLQKFNQFVKDSCDFISDMNLYNDIIKDLELLDSIKEIFKKVIYAPYNTVDFDNKIVPIPKVKVAEDFDKELFKQVLEQCGFEIKEK